MRELLTVVGVLVAVGGLVVLARELLPRAERPSAPTRRRRSTFTLPRPLAAVLGTHLPTRARRTHQRLLVAGLAAGVLGWLFSGWVLAVVVLPAAVVGLPTLLRPPAGATDVDKLDALESWTRTLVGVLATGGSLEATLRASLRSVPAAIKPQVQLLVSRMNAGWRLRPALLAFADDLDDATGDLVVASLQLNSQRRGGGLSEALKDLAETTAEEVNLRRKIEAGLQTPRQTTRFMTIGTLTVFVLAFLFWPAFTETYSSGLGQLVLAVLLTVYIGALVWVRSLAVGKPAPRFLPAPGARQRTSA
ncbi:type II secretion system F family protein [uncultured Pseudokineococcus sp.]|uniref:type II secretion system F family protein n=1 Tax=uncultured Pseudokineococcus sp. TaxID=1642928 RepID=UPI00261A8A52|nr:type II secretion system F family protein [uncultured Pseudokineococcus sp.]